jgi:hypothetical protein
VDEGAVENRLTSFLGGGAAFGLRGLAGPSGESRRAQQYIPILKSFAFNDELSERHRLIEVLGHDNTSSAKAGEDPRWHMYRLLQKRFSCEFSDDTGNLTLRFEDSDRQKATKILSFYLDDLRERLRGQEVRNTSQAVNSLVAEIKVSPDSMLQKELYDVVANQLEREKLAQVEADFAFIVLSPPCSSDRVSFPWAKMFAGIGGVLTLALFVAWEVLMYVIDEGRVAFTSAKGSTGSNADI